MLPRDAGRAATRRFLNGRAAAHGREGLQRDTPSDARVPRDCPIGHRAQPRAVARQRQEGGAVSQALPPGVTYEGQGRAVVKRPDGHLRCPLTSDRACKRVLTWHARLGVSTACNPDAEKGRQKLRMKVALFRRAHLRLSHPFHPAGGSSQGTVRRRRGRAERGRPRHRLFCGLPLHLLSRPRLSSPSPLPDSTSRPNRRTARCTRLSVRYSRSTLL